MNQLCLPFNVMNQFGHCPSQTPVPMPMEETPSTAQLCIHKDISSNISYLIMFQDLPVAFKNSLIESNLQPINQELESTPDIFLYLLENKTCNTWSYWCSNQDGSLPSYLNSLLLKFIYDIEDSSKQQTDLLSPMSNFTSVHLCQICKLAFRDQQELSKHGSAKHGQVICNLPVSASVNVLIFAQDRSMKWLKFDRNAANMKSYCLYCLTKTHHPRLGRGESYSCGFKPYRCDVCNYSTTAKGNLAIHEQSDKHLNNIQEHAQLSNFPVPNTKLESASMVPPDSTQTATSPFMKFSFNAMSSLDLQEVKQPNSIQTHPTKYIDSSYSILPQLNNKPSMQITQVDAASLKEEDFLHQVYANCKGQFLCLVCANYSSDSLDSLIEHAEFNRTPMDLDRANAHITIHTGGLWYCQLCTYRSPLKANFQLHCKTEKHAQRMNLLAHVCEGGLANRDRVFNSPGFLERKQPNTNSAATQQISGASINLASAVQMKCLPCDFFTTSVHKIRLHCQAMEHMKCVDVYSKISSKWSGIQRCLKNAKCNAVNLVQSGKIDMGGFMRIMNILQEIRLSIVCIQCPIGASSVFQNIYSAVQHCTKSKIHQTSASLYCNNVEKNAEQLEVIWNCQSDGGNLEKLMQFLNNLISDTQKSDDCFTNVTHQSQLSDEDIEIHQDSEFILTSNISARFADAYIGLRQEELTERESLKYSRRAKSLDSLESLKSPTHDAAYNFDDLQLVNKDIENPWKLTCHRCQMLHFRDEYAYSIHIEHCMKHKHSCFICKIQTDSDASLLKHLYEKHSIDNVSLIN